MKMSIRTKLIVAILTPLLAVFLILLVIQYHTGKRQATAQAEQHLRELAAHHATRLDQHFATAQRAAEAAANLLAEQKSAFMLRRAGLLLGRDLLKHPSLHGARIAFEPGVLGVDEHLGVWVYRLERKPRAPRARPPRPTAKPKGGKAPGKPAKPSAKPHRSKASARPVPTPAPVVDRVADAPQLRGGPVREAIRARLAPGLKPPTPPRLRPTVPRNFALGLRGGDLTRDRPEFAEAPWYVKAKRARQAVWSEPDTSELTGGVPVVRCSVPILWDDEVRGVVAYDLAVPGLQRYVGGDLVEGGYGLLLSRGGLLVAYPDEKVAMIQTLADLAESLGRPKLAALADREQDVWRLGDFRTRRPSWIVLAAVPTADWTFAVVLDERQIMAPVYQRLRQNAALILGGMGVIVLLVLLISIDITRPIGRLARAVRRVAGGDLDARVEDVDSRDEIGEFARAFNTMVVDLKDHVAALTKATSARLRVEGELRVAREIQASLLPRRFPPFPERDEFDLHAVIVPAKQVAGDFFDFFFVDEDVLAVLIADVSGKGVPAALFMAVARTVFREQSARGGSPSDVLSRANHILADGNDRTMFVTAFFGHYHTRSGRLVWANAGHNPPCLRTADGVRSLRPSTGSVLGVWRGLEYGQCEATLAPRDTLLLYTDGVTEARDSSDSEFGLARLERLVAEDGPEGAAGVCRRVIQSVEVYRSHPQQDDVTLLALRRNV